MTNVYEELINHHRIKVRKAWELMAPELSNFDDYDKEKINKLIENHDLSKFSDDEFYTYIEVRLSSNIDLVEVEDKLKEVNLIHLNTNPHHWQYYYRLNEYGEATLSEMPKEYIIEMACDYIALINKRGVHEVTPNWMKEFESMKLYSSSKDYFMSLIPLMNKILANFR